MKKFVLTLVVIIICACVFGASVESARETAMGSVGAAVTTQQGTFFRNPASLYMVGNRSSFTVDLREKGSLPSGNQNLALNAFFTGKNVSLDIDLGFNGEKSKSQDGIYTFHKTTLVDLVVAAGYKAVGAGVGVSIEGGRTKEGEIRSDHRLIDFMTEGLLAEMHRDTNLTRVTLRLGAGVRGDNWTFGALLNDFIDSKEDKKFKFQAERVFKSSCLGIRFYSDEFSSRGRLNTFVTSCNLEVWNMGSGAPAYKGGADFTLQLSKKAGVSLCLGVSYAVKDEDSRKLTGGLICRFADFDLYTSAEVPFALLTGEDRIFVLTLGGSWKI